jgi:predicted nucleic acid-binding protein
LKVFIDSNIPMYVAGRGHPNREPALRFLQKVCKGRVEGCTSTEVLQEILNRYLSLYRRDLAAEVYDLFAGMCPIVFPVTLADTDRCREMLEGVTGSGVRDALHAAVMLNNDVARIATFDRSFDRIAGVNRVELD